MQNKAILFATVILSIFLIGSASALYSCEDSQTILKLSTVDNAHVELYNQPLYSLKLCYSDIYGINYTLSNPHVCNAGNTVAKLAQQTNSHLEAPNGTLFNNLACYGDLSCSLRTGACLSNEKQVLSLAQQTNSHVSFNNTLTFKLCCSSAFALTNGNVSTNNSIGNVFGFSVTSPVNGSTYNDFVPISINIGTATSVNYSIDSNTVVNYVSPISVSLSAGNHFIVVQASNGSAFTQQTIFFTIINTTSTGNSGNNGGNSGGSSGSGGVRSGATTVSQGNRTELISQGDEPLYLETEKSKKTFALTPIQLFGTIIFLLIILLLLLITLLHKRNQPNKVK